MELFSVGIVSSVFTVCDIVEEKIEKAVDAHHVADIEIAEQRDRQQKGVHFEFSVFDQIFDPKRYEGKPHHGVDPHGVVLLDDPVAAKRIEYGKNNDGNGTALNGGLVHVVSKRPAADRRFDQKENQQAFQHSVGWKQTKKIGKGTCEIVGVDPHKLSAHGAGKGVEQAGVAFHKVSERFKKPNVLSI